MSAPASEEVPLPEIQIFPERLLMASTTEKLLNRLYDIKNVRQINIQGEGLPAVMKSGPGTGGPVDHPERKKIKVKGKEVELTVQVGRIFVEISDIDHVPQALKDIEAVCKEVLPFGFTLEVGRYNKFRPTTTDYMKGLVK
ncbi:MAG: methyl-coenzyme M reductase operon protein D [Methanomassiliicoccales archaeon]|jgi:methyl-coenzyme M reductase subunit D|nr:methyl-coenzyme M reductase operon protein D [Methanomassiliicoccales archaeon]HRU11336.1 methyl-coenzyme M reductase operon protein D [Methanomassiliicoccales archaeon]